MVITGIITAVLCPIAAYLLGSLSSAIVVCWLFRLPDPRMTGSQNPGTTNVLRIGGKLPAIITLLGDVVKGMPMVWLVLYLQLAPSLVIVTMLAALLGHMYPLYFNFQGGKGIATALGLLLVLSWKLAVLVLLIWILMLIISRISSVAGISAALATPLVAYWLLNSINYTAGLGIMALLIIWRHKSNIKRLLRGQESSIKLF